MKLLTSTAALLLAGTLANAATLSIIDISTMSAPGYTELAVDSDNLSITADGGPGTGGSVVGNPFSYAVKSGQPSHAFGRYNVLQPTNGSWIDSNDNERLFFTVSAPGAKSINSLQVAITDAADIRPFFTVNFYAESGAFTSLAINTKRDNANQLLLQFDFDDPAAYVDMWFESTRNDGFGISNVRACYVNPKKQRNLSAMK